ncbi:MAG: hypothetical protein AABX02_05115 [archaeon]
MKEAKLILGIILVAVGIWIVYSTISNPIYSVHDYDSCAAAGYPILKTYPGKCELPNGTVYIQSIPVNSFEECAAYYPVMESYPRQCNTPDGQHFVEVISTSGCESDSECTSGYFCKSGLCTEFSPDISCTQNSDCTLIDIIQRYSCCYAGQCDAIDYSNAKWKSVNKEWFMEGQQQYCPSLDACGPAPGCPTQIAYDGFVAACQSNICVKIPKAT